MEGEDQRLDIWLWRTRFFKTRAIAAEAISKRGVRIDRTGLVRKSTKPGASITVGDILTFRKGSDVISLRVLELPGRRGPASEAQACYQIADDKNDE